MKLTAKTSYKAGNALDHLHLLTGIPFVSHKSSCNRRVTGTPQGSGDVGSSPCSHHDPYCAKNVTCQNNENGFNIMFNITLPNWPFQWPLGLNFFQT